MYIDVHSVVNKINGTTCRGSNSCEQMRGHLITNDICDLATYILRQTVWRGKEIQEEPRQYKYYIGPNNYVKSESTGLACKPEKIHEVYEIDDKLRSISGPTVMPNVIDSYKTIQIRYTFVSSKLLVYSN